MTKFYKNCSCFATTEPLSHTQQHLGAGAFTPAPAKKSGSGSTFGQVSKKRVHCWSIYIISLCPIAWAEMYLEHASQVNISPRTGL